MSLKNIDIKVNYESYVDDLINDFYVPVLNESKYYDRIAGFFTSSSFAVSAKGIYGLLNNNGSIRMLVSPRLSKSDIEVINKNEANYAEVMSSKFDKEFLLDEKITLNKHTELLAWFLANGFLEIRIIFIKKDGEFLSADEIEKNAIFHQKVGILTDCDGNKISFSGSINETLAAWNDNIEEFKTFKSWDQYQKPYCESDIKKFEQYWNGERKNTIVKGLPESIRLKLVDIAPNDIQSLVKFIKNKDKNRHDKLSLFPYQKDARDKWMKSNRKILLEMATGTGKTRTALACIDDVISKKMANVIIVATPQSTLTSQWRVEAEKLLDPFDEVIIADGNHNWRPRFEEALLKVKSDLLNNVIVYTTHTTASSKDFIRIVRNNFNTNTTHLFVGDEVHALGSKKQKRALLDIYKYRIGLSATPSRWFDEKGTNLIVDYFDDSKFEFTIRDALMTINPITQRPFLCDYYYYPKFTKLTDEESEKYYDLSVKISKLSYLNDEERNSFYDKLLRDRADIIKNAHNKANKLKQIILEIGVDEIENTIIFVSPQQKDVISEMLKGMGIQFHHFTQEQGTKSDVKYGGLSERQYIIKMFKRKLIKVLVAIKCLDEGIDIPTADTAILVSSTTNPREYIQRVGRVIRQSDAKEYASIYDSIINPDIDVDTDSKIMEREFNRIETIATNAKNNASVLSEIYREFKGGNYGN